MGPDYEAFLKEWMEEGRRKGADHRPSHCDPRILHALGECRYCDDPIQAPLHKFRRDNDISYTNKNNGTWPCPANLARQDGVNKWHGNIAKPDGCLCKMFMFPDDPPCPIHK